MMVLQEVIQMAKKIVELDQLRDEIWEEFAKAAGDDAYELLRKVQNSL
ncbi:hypothetical protein PB1_04595 [Bacillus methanolicus PB1]|uniref:Uncharacterized protein n=1 Tax=Bacillus methanolicus PB1 TaxID=997296 RepID=I3E6R4_BACMT|nr:hypothetical protein [Bacillus methanolicus]EIJ82185.1 hypothetical protein PB1_04595 [Bacillus methanolicus PB1]